MTNNIDDIAGAVSLNVDYDLTSIIRDEVTYDNSTGTFSFKPSNSESEDTNTKELTQGVLITIDNEAKVVTLDINTPDSVTLEKGISEDTITLKGKVSASFPYDSEIHHLFLPTKAIFIDFYVEKYYHDSPATIYKVSYTIDEPIGWDYKNNGNELITDLTKDSEYTFNGIKFDYAKYSNYSAILNRMGNPAAFISAFGTKYSEGTHELDITDNDRKVKGTLTKTKDTISYKGIIELDEGVPVNIINMHLTIKW